LAYFLLLFPAGRFVQALQAVSADEHLLSINSLGLEVELLASDGFDVRVAPRVALERAPAAAFAACHTSKIEF